MAPLHAAVCLKVIPRPEEVRLDPRTGLMDRSQARSVLNPADKNALEAALSLTEAGQGRVTVLSMGPPSFRPYLELALAMGAAEALLVSDRALAGADTYATSRTLARAVERLEGVDLVLCGEESGDAGTGQVPPGLAEWLGWPQATYAFAMVPGRGHLEVRRSATGGSQRLRLQLPAVVSVVQGCNSPRFPDFRRLRDLGQKAPIRVWSLQDLGLAAEEVGLAGSLTEVGEVVEGPRRERRRERLEGAEEELGARLAELLLASVQGT